MLHNYHQKKFLFNIKTLNYNVIIPALYFCRDGIRAKSKMYVP